MVMATFHSLERHTTDASRSRTRDVDEATHDILIALAYEGEVAIDALIARTGIPRDVIESLLTSSDVFEVFALGDEPVSARLTDHGYQLARSEVTEWAA